jgi:uncharacterized damage-inducible protein DinB
MRVAVRIFLVCLLAPAAVAAAQDNPLSTYNKQVYSGLKQILLSAAEKMPAADYPFKPTDAVRSFGQIVGHVADSQYTFCSLVLGEKNPSPHIEETKTSKADLIAALKGAFSYCDRAYDGMTDAAATQTVQFMGSDAPRLGVLNVNAMHSALHYGNIITYLRMKNIVPPSSDPAVMQRLMKH